MKNLKYSKNLAELICSICILRKKIKNQNVIDCAYRTIDNEYCDNLINLMKTVYEEEY